MVSPDVRSRIPELVGTALGTHAAGKVLLVVPDNTRTAPLGEVFREIAHQVSLQEGQLDVLIALGTHRPMSVEEIHRRLEIGPDEYRQVGLHNHAWKDPEAIVTLGTLNEDEVLEISEGLLACSVPITIHRKVLEADLVLILGPVFPHEVVGFSGGFKYLFPGIAGAEIIDFFHWLGALITSPRVMGHRDTAVREVIHRAAALVPTPTRALCMVVHEKQLVGLHAGETIEAWQAAVEQSSQLHIETWEKPADRIIACAPEMYDDLWVAGKCMYKLESVVADGGELVIHAPHLSEISTTHGATIRRLGYHVRDYFLADWPRFQHEPWGVIAHCTHVRGVGKMVGGVEHPRIRVTLASKVPREECEAIGLGYLDPATVKLDGSEGVVIPRAGETLYRLAEPPAWATGRELRAGR